MMEVIQSLEDDKGRVYAIVKHPEADQQKNRVNEYEAMYLMDDELQSLGGSVGYNTADFPTLQMAEDYMISGLSLQDEFPDIWLDMIQAQIF